MENKRRKVHEELEVVQTGFANGVAEGFPLEQSEKDKMIDEAEEAYGKFLDALNCDWRNDPNSMETPRRVANAYVNDLWAGRYTAMSPITSFPSDGYDGVIIERNIPLTSMCSHHHQTIGGVVHIGSPPAAIKSKVGIASQIAAPAKPLAPRIQRSRIGRLPKNCFTLSLMRETF